MFKTAMTFPVILLLAVVATPTAYGDRPGSYDNVDNPQRGQQRTRVEHNARHSMRHGFGRPAHRSSFNFYVGAAPAYFYSPVISYGSYYPSWDYSYWGPTGIYYDPTSHYSEYYLPPIYQPAELNYGPQAVERFLGVRRPPPVVARPAVAVPDAVPDAVKAAAVADKLRHSNAAARERARRFLVFGDALFLKQRCHEAVQRYKSAISIAPDLPEAYYRQGFALVAVKQYRLAAKAMRIAVELDPGMLRDDRLLHTLYGDSLLVKNAHLEQMADRAIANPDNGDLLFLIGAFLYANGEGDKAAKYLQRAFELAEPDATFLAPLLAPVPPAKPAATEMDT